MSKPCFWLTASVLRSRLLPWFRAALPGYAGAARDTPRSEKEGTQ